MLKGFWRKFARTMQVGVSLAIVVIPFTGIQAAELSSIAVTADKETSGDAFVLFDDNTRQWVSAECRASLVDAGVSVVVTPWLDIDAVPVAATVTACEDFFPDFSLLVTPDKSSAGDGWAKFADESKQWISAECRVELESAGYVAQVTPWPAIDGLVYATEFVACDVLLDANGGDSTSAPTGTRVIVTEDKLTSGYGWVLLGDNTKFWIDETCRMELEADSFAVQALPWPDIDAFADATTVLACADIPRPTGTPPGYQLAVTSDKSDSGDGFVIFPDNTRQWVDAACRNDLIAAGWTANVLTWPEIEVVTEKTEFINCVTIIDPTNIPVENDGDNQLMVTVDKRLGGDAWVIYPDAKRQQVDAACREELTRKGFVVIVVDYSVIENYDFIGNQLACDEIVVPELDLAQHQPGPRIVSECAVTAAIAGNPIQVNAGDDINAIVAAAQPGDEFLIKSGVYRLTEELEVQPNQTFICEANAVLNGAVLLTQAWTLDTTTSLYVYSGAPTTVEPMGVMQTGFEINATSNDLFINDRLYLRVDDTTAVNSTPVLAQDGYELYAGTFYQDGDALYVATNPTGSKVEMSQAKHAFFPGYAEADNVTVEACTIEKFASDDLVAPIRLDLSVGWTLRNVTSRLNHTGGALMGGETSIYCGDYSHNGQMGVSSAQVSGESNGYVVTVKGAQIAYNNWAHYNVQWHAGGAKFFQTPYVNVSDSVVHHNEGLGLWADYDIQYLNFNHNHIYRNASRAIQLEAVYDASIDHNLIECNTQQADLSLSWSWFWGSQILVKNSPRVEVSFNKIDVKNGQGLGIVDNNFRVGTMGPQQALDNQVHHNTVSFADVATFPGDMNYYDYFFQKTGVESDGPTTTYSNGATNCTADPIMEEFYTQPEIDALVADCLANDGYVATREGSNNATYLNTYNYATEVGHFRIAGVSYDSFDIPEPWETNSTFNVGSTTELSELCQ